MQRTLDKNRAFPIPESVSLGLEPEPKKEDFEIINLIGGGKFGRVHLAKHKITKVTYAIKEIDKKRENFEQGTTYFRRELEIMYKIRHPNIVRLYGHFEDENSIYFVMEYLGSGSLYDLIKEKKISGMPKKKVFRIMIEVMSAVYFLHNMNPPIIHRDIKPENILLTEDGTAKLTDFGWSNYIKVDEIRNTFCGSPIYFAPEIIKKQAQTEKVDLWCLGVLLFEVFIGNPPFNGKTLKELLNNIFNVKIEWPNSALPVFKSLISKILKSIPEKRLSIPDILSHPFFKLEFPKAKESLIKPGKNMIHRAYIISKDTPEEETKIIKDIQSKGYLIDVSQFKNNEYLSILYYQSIELSKICLTLKKKIQILEKKISDCKTGENKEPADLSELEKEQSILQEQFEKYKKMYESNQINSDLNKKISDLKEKMDETGKEKFVKEFESLKAEIDEESKTILNSFLEEKENDTMLKIDEFIQKVEEEAIKFNSKISNLSEHP